MPGFSRFRVELLCLKTAKTTSLTAATQDSSFAQYFGILLGLLTPRSQYSQNKNDNATPNK